jgi:hypothetical protein
LAVACGTSGEESITDCQKGCALLQKECTSDKFEGEGCLEGCKKNCYIQNEFQASCEYLENYYDENPCVENDCQKRCGVLRELCRDYEFDGERCVEDCKINCYIQNEFQASCEHLESLYDEIMTTCKDL